MSTHTPGPWIARKVAGPGWTGQKGFAIDYNEDQEQVVDFVYEEADAYLIASAPDLLDALEATNLLLRTQRHACESTEVCHMLASHIKRNNAAIAKARGES